MINENRSTKTNNLFILQINYIFSPEIPAGGSISGSTSMEERFRDGRREKTAPLRNRK
ncbi:hypothetical protein DPMN_065695 [Dreissena polymorpha]|uniref:Uncharacterized protein n=1 Tax=Dreissena polymorpha TaxID=45954 RepID=A0A9D4BRH3_DREPO|nr:hypothetical protein DPMN_065695 [Dreissena polymorpha]